MKAIVYTKYGALDVLQLKEVEKPVPQDDAAIAYLEGAFDPLRVRQ